MINQITKMRLPDGSEVAFVDWTDQPLWSTAYAVNTFTDEEVNFFTYAPGDVIAATSNATNAPQSTWRDANNTLAGAFADSEEMLVYAIKPEVSLYVCTNGDLDTLTVLGQTTGFPLLNAPSLKLMSDQLILRLWVSQKVLQEAPFGYFNTGFGPSGVGTFFPSDVGVQDVWANQGLPSQEAVRSLAMPVYIGGTEKWRVTASNFTGGEVDFAVNMLDTVTSYGNDVAARIRIILDGLYKRPVS